MEINNVFSPVPFYANKRYWHSNKWYTYGQKCPIIMTAEKTLPFQLVVSTGVTLSSFTIKKADNDASVMTVNTVGNYFNIDAETYSIIQVKACTIGVLPYGNYYYALTLSDGSTYISDIIAIISDMSKCIKITYKNVENLYFSSGHIDFTNDFVFELYLPTTIGKPEYEYEEELTKRLGYKFVESQVVNKVYKFTFPATEQLCDAYRFVRMCDYIRIDTYNPDFSDYDHYNIIYLSSEVEWLDNGDIASVETSFETDSIVQKLQDYSRTQLVNFYNALLSNSDEALKFDDETIAQYYSNYIQSIDGKMIRQLNAVSSISDNTVIAIDENNGAGAANKILLKPLLINTVAEQLQASEVLANFQQHINNSAIHITAAERAILSLFGVDDNGDVYVKGDKGFYTNSFVSAKGKSSSTGGGSGASALYQLVDVLANSTNDGVQGATTNSVLMYNGTKWYAGAINTGLDEAALKSYLDANKYTTTTYVDSQISTINSQLDTKADKTALSAYLPLSGGTITGDLTVNGTIYVGNTNYVYHTGNLAGDNAWITLASDVISHKTIHANNITLIASSGQFVTGYTVDKAGHIVSISQRALNASDIPSIAITQVTGLQDALDKKVDSAFFARVFGLLDADGNEIAVNDVATVASSIKAKFGLWTEQYISAKGKSSSTGGGGGARALYQLVDILPNSTNDGVLNAANGSVLMYNGSKWQAGNVVTDISSLTLNVNGSSLFTYDGKSSITANLTVPTKVSQLTNDTGFITGVSSSMVTSALGYTPYNSTNPNGYISSITKAMVEGVLTGNITSHTHDYLPLSGGTITGTLIKRTTGQNYITFQNGNGDTYGYLGFNGANTPIYIPKEANTIYTLIHSGNLNTSVIARLGTLSNNISGNATTASKLQTARTIWGQGFNGDANVSGNLTGVGSITRTAYTAVDTDIYGNLKFHNLNSASDNYWQVFLADDTVAFVVTNNGNVGVGTRTPSYKLHTVGDIYSSMYLRAASGLLINSSDTTASRFISCLGKTGTSYVTFGYANTAGNQGEIGYTYDSDASIYNYVSLGMHSAPKRIHLYYSGNAGVGPSGTAMSYAWHVIGDSYSSGYTRALSGFIKGNSSDSYVLLGGGGHKLESSLSVANANSSTYATNSTYLYASDSPYRYGDSSPYYMKMRYNVNNDSRWYLSAYPETPKSIAVDYSYTSGIAAAAIKLRTARTIWGHSFDGTGDIAISKIAKMPYVLFKNYNDDSAAGYCGRGSSGSNQIYLTAYGGNAVGIGANNTDNVLYIGTSLNVGIGTTSPSVKLHVIGDIAATGAVTAKASSSDIRLKTDISDYKALSIIRSHRSIKYHWNAVAKANADIFNDDYWHYGLIAQDIQRDMPQMVSDVFKDYLVINYERLIPICWKGLQEVDDEVTKLKKKVRKLEMEIRELKQKEDRL